VRNLHLLENEERPWIVAIGASGAEGLDDVRALIGALPTTLPAIVMVVLHRPWNRPTQLQAVLAQKSRLPIVIAAQGEHFEEGTVYIGEPAEHLTLAARSFGVLIDDPHRHYGVEPWIFSSSRSRHTLGSV
jgi:two-component system chemotaxis response regulator CheB